MKNIRLFAFGIISMVALTLSACNKEEVVEETAEVVEAEEVNMFGLTDEEQKMYAEYAAGVLMKYNAGTNNRVLEGQKLIQQEAKEAAAREQALRREQLAAEYEKGKNTNNKENTSSNSSGSSSGVSTDVGYISDMASVAGMNDFSIRYMGCEITDSYPKAGDDLFMAMDATAGKVLLVAEFAVTNNSAETKNFDMFSNQGKFKLKINGKNYKSQYTLLLNDLSMYKGQVGANESIDTVLIFEIPQAEADNIVDMTLAITMNGNTEYMSLTGNVSSDIDSNIEEEAMSEEVSFEEDTINEEDTESETEDNTTEDNTTEDVGDEEVSDLAEEYMEALEALESDTVYEGTVDSSSGNVTVVGSNRN